MLYSCVGVFFVWFYHSVLLCLLWLWRYSIVTELVSSPFSKKDINQICHPNLSLCCKSTETFHHYSSIHYPWFIILTVYPLFTLGRKRKHIPTTEQNHGHASWQLPKACVLWVLSKSLTARYCVALVHSLAEVLKVEYMDLVLFQREFWVCWTGLLQWLGAWGDVLSQVSFCSPREQDSWGTWTVWDRHKIRETWNW